MNEYEFLIYQDSQQMNAESGVVETASEFGFFRNDPPQITVGITSGVFYGIDCRAFPDPFPGYYLFAFPLAVILI